MKIQVKGRYVYETCLSVKVDDTVLLPNSGRGLWLGRVTAVDVEYDGVPLRIIGRVEEDLDAIRSRGAA